MATEQIFKYSIYELRDTDGSVRYVGITRLSLSERLKDHVKNARRRRTYRDNWIRSLSEPPSIHLIEVTDDTSREAHWISVHRQAGFRLTNLTNGGDGISGYRHTEESREKMSRFHKGRSKPSAAYKTAAEEKWKRQDYRNKIISGLMGHEVSESSRRKISETRKALYASGRPNPMLGRKHSEESKQKNREAQIRNAAIRRGELIVTS